MTDTPDREIARGLREGRSEAWSALYDSHFDLVWCAVARALGPSADVADVVQETFLAAACSAHTYEPDRGSLGLWLIGIARNHVGDCLRARHRSGRVARGGDLSVDVGARLAQWLDGQNQPPPEVLATAETVAAVRGVLAKLPKEYRTLLMYRYCDGATVEEIARHQDCSAGAVRSKLARARRTFRAAFGPAEGATYSESYDDEP